MTELDYGRFEALTFDCYGTLIDWEAGILAGLRPVLAARGVTKPTDDELLAKYANAEFGAGELARTCATARSSAAACARSPPTTPSRPDLADVAAFADSVGKWPPFPDSVDALRRLHERFRLGVITNCDDDLFARSAARLDTDFDWVVTAQRARGYKPNPHNFEVALEHIGLPRDKILHVAQSLFHDHVPAKKMGFATVWIDRRAGRPGSGATPPAKAKPDATFSDMASFAQAATAG